MAEEIVSNTYEEARKQQLLENQKRFEDLGILKISKTLSDLSKSEKKSKQREVKLKIRNAPVIEPRRSTRERNPIRSYVDDVDIGLPPVRRKSSSNSSWASYLARPLEEVKMASYEQRVYAMKCAEKLQSNLQSENPSFVKSMVRSHVYSCFWLGLPMSFCKKHLPKSTASMILEDEEGNESEAVFISQRTGLSGGWRAFALEHKLDDGDALVFELVEPRKFKIYTVKASESGNQEEKHTSDIDEEATETPKTSKRKRTPKTPEENEKKLTTKSSTRVKNSKKETREATGSQARKPKKETVEAMWRSTRKQN